MCPSVMTSIFNRNNEINKYTTRHVGLLHVPISKINVYKTIKHRGVNLWNYIVKQWILIMPSQHSNG